MDHDRQYIRSQFFCRVKAPLWKRPMVPSSETGAFGKDHERITMPHPVKQYDPCVAPPVLPGNNHHPDHRSKNGAFHFIVGEHEISSGSASNGTISKRDDWWLHIYDRWFVKVFVERVDNLLFTLPMMYMSDQETLESSLWYNSLPLSFTCSLTKFCQYGECYAPMRK